MRTRLGCENAKFYGSLVNWVYSSATFVLVYQSNMVRVWKVVNLKRLHFATGTGFTHTCCIVSLEDYHVQRNI